MYKATKEAANDENILDLLGHNLSTVLRAMVISTAQTKAIAIPDPYTNFTIVWDSKGKCNAYWDIDKKLWWSVRVLDKVNYNMKFEIFDEIKINVVKQHA